MSLVEEFFTKNEAISLEQLFGYCVRVVFLLTVEA